MTPDSAARLSQIALLGEAAEGLEEAAIFVWDEDRNYVAANDAACALVGKTHAELPYMMSVCWRKAPA
jgi:PAS domain-containing protein